MLVLAEYQECKKNSNRAFGRGSTKLGLLSQLYISALQIKRIIIRLITNNNREKKQQLN
jgi:hypothetical protein